MFRKNGGVTSGGSISFDRAAGYYDKTRNLSPEAAERITDLLHRELDGNDGVLEIGVGTGRIALPLARRGIELTGLDLSRTMLDKLVENAGGSSPFPLLQGDASKLPFRDGSFDAAIASWVLHLVPTWREVLTELTRVMRPGGVLLVDVGSEHESILTKLTWRFRDVAGITDWPRGVKDYGEVDKVLGGLGARARDLEHVPEVLRSSIEYHIGLLENGIYSVSWGVDEGKRKLAANELRAWAEKELGSITEERAIEVTHVWRAYDI